MNESDLGGTAGAGAHGSLAAAHGGRTEEGPLEDIHFAYDSFDLDEASRSTLRSHAQWMESHPGASVEVEGHCDERGTIEYNLALGAKRAAAAKEYLIALGVSAGRLSTISYGEELPLCRDSATGAITSSSWESEKGAAMRVYPLIVFGFLAAFTAGCATRADLERVRRETQELRAKVADSQVALDRLQRQVSASGESGDAQRDRQAVEALARRVADLESQLGRMQSQALTSPVEGGEMTGGALAGGVQRTQAAAIAWEREAPHLQPGGADPQYQRALQLYREGQSEEAIRLLRDFLRQNPKSDLADNAQFWLGEAYYSRGDYNRAIIELNEVLLKYSQGDEVPGALLGLATAFANSGDKIDARLILQKLISDHGDTEEAKVGREQLKTLTN